MLSNTPTHTVQAMNAKRKKAWSLKLSFATPAGTIGETTSSLKRCPSSPSSRIVSFEAGSRRRRSEADSAMLSGCLITHSLTKRGRFEDGKEVWVLHDLTIKLWDSEAGIKLRDRETLNVEREDLIFEVQKERERRGEGRRRRVSATAELSEDRRHRRLEVTVLISFHFFLSSLLKVYRHWLIFYKYPNRIN